MKQKSKVHTERNFEEVSIVACVQYRNTESHTYNEHDLGFVSRDAVTSSSDHPSSQPCAGYRKLSNGFTLSCVDNAGVIRILDLDMRWAASHYLVATFQDEYPPE